MILITGANGQLGKEVTELLSEQAVDHVALGREELDITNKRDVNDIFEEIHPSIVFHCAAYTAVDKAEDEGKEANWAVNVEGTRNIAEAAKKVNATMIYISTDYVFDGTYQGEYKEDHTPSPKNEYGKAKLAGEQVVQDTLDAYYIIRTSWVFGEFGHNFVYTMQRLAKDHDRLTIVNDQTGRPTWTKTLAEFMLHLTKIKAEYGIYHLSNDNSCTWYEFAKEILKEETVEVAAVTSEEFPQKAYRPPYSVMSLEKAKATGFKIPTWKESLLRFLSSD